MIYKWEPSDQQDSIVLFWLKSRTKKSFSGMAIEFHYDGTVGMLYDEVLYDSGDLDEGEAWQDYKLYSKDDHALVQTILNPPTWNI